MVSRLPLTRPKSSKRGAWCMRKVLGKIENEVRSIARFFLIWKPTGHEMRKIDSDQRTVRAITRFSSQGPPAATDP
jgi:hypothetical protein